MISNMMLSFCFLAGGGLELKPVAGLFIGGRYNLFFNLLGNEPTTSAYPSYVPDYSGNLKNGLLQIYAGYQF